MSSGGLWTVNCIIQSEWWRFHTPVFYLWQTFQDFVNSVCKIRREHDGRWFKLFSAERTRSKKSHCILWTVNCIIQSEWWWFHTPVFYLWQTFQDFVNSVCKIRREHDDRWFKLFSAERTRSKKSHCILWTVNCIIQSEWMVKIPHSGILFVTNIWFKPYLQK
jgi:SRSO17 transposase